MCWYKSVKKNYVVTGGLLLLCLSYSCKPDIKETGAALKYFDLKGYFYADSARLAKLNKAINKTVIHNGTSETKTMHIANWGRELSLFNGSDINKPAWKNSYTIQNSSDSLIYLAKYPELKTRKIIIKKTAGKVSAIYINNNIHNLLYSTIENLKYVPGSFYSIEKTQQVKIMGANYYLVKGVF